jgi:immune inhibitor A
VHKDSQPSSIPSQPAVPVFDDRNAYWFNADEHAATGSHVGRYQPGWNSVEVPKTGTQIRVKSVSGQGKLMQVEVRPAK